MQAYTWPGARGIPAIEKSSSSGSRTTPPCTTSAFGHSSLTASATLEGSEMSQITTGPDPMCSG